WSSDVCSSDLRLARPHPLHQVGTSALLQRVVLRLIAPAIPTTHGCHLLEGSVSRSPPVPRPSLQPLPKAQAGRHGGAGHPLSPAWIPGHGRVQKPPVEAPGEGPAFGLLEVAGREALVEGLVAVADPRAGGV